MFSCVLLSRIQFCDPMNCSPPGSSVHGIFQARIVEWFTISFFRGYSWLRDQTCISCIGKWILYHCASWETHFHVLDFFKENSPADWVKDLNGSLRDIFLNIFYLFIFGCARSFFLCIGFLSLWWAGAILHCGTWASHCGDFSCCGAHALGAQASVGTAHGLSSCGSQALERGLSSCSTWPCCSKACGIFWDQGSNPYSLPWQADSYPLYHQGSPKGYLLIAFV